jgi:hypothetical protein
MSPHSPRRARNLCAAALAALALTACQDKRIRELDVGITRDSAIKIIADGMQPKLDTIQNVYRHNRYFVQGREFDIYLFDPENRKFWEDPEVLDKELTPVVVVDGKVDGWGWGHMDDVTSKYGIRLRAGSEPTPTAPAPPPAATDSAKKAQTA